MAEVIEDTPIHLRGNGRPISEERTLTALKVTGTIPAELDGRFVRNGANPFTGFSSHPFLGDGMLHGVRIRDGRAEWYRNRYVQTPFIANPTTDLDWAVLMDMKSSKANTHVIGHAGKILALEEGHFPYVIGGELETLGPTDFDGVLNGAFTAHRRSARSPARCSPSATRQCRPTCATCGWRRMASWCRWRTSRLAGRP